MNKTYIDHSSCYAISMDIIVNIHFEPLKSKNEKSVIKFIHQNYDVTIRDLHLLLLL